MHDVIDLDLQSLPLDEETGLYFYRSRYHDSLKGRFLQRDRQGYDAGMNLYEYVNSKPTKLTDASGEDPCFLQHPCIAQQAVPLYLPYFEISSATSGRGGPTLGQTTWHRESQAQYGDDLRIVLEVHFDSPLFFFVARAEEETWDKDWNPASVDFIATFSGNWQYACENNNGARINFPPQQVVGHQPYKPSLPYVTLGGRQLQPDLDPTKLSCNVGGSVGHFIILQAAFRADRYGGPHGIQTYTNYP